MGLQVLIFQEYKENSRLNIDIRSVLIDALGKNINFEIINNSKNIEVGKTNDELIIKSINKDKNNKAQFKWEANTKSQNINPTSISLDLKINKKKVGE